jgi:anti-sigma factor RsiW
MMAAGEDCNKAAAFRHYSMSDLEKNNEWIEEWEMKRYWLGELAPEAERRLEERSSADEELFDQLLGVREELFDAYARGELSEAEQSRFEQRLLQSSSDRAQLEFARSFVGALDDEIAATDRAGAASAKRQMVGDWLRFPRLAWAIACAATLAGVGWLLSDNIRLRGQIAQLQSEQAAQRQNTRELEERLAQAGSGAVTQPTPQPVPSPAPVAPGGKESLPASILPVTLMQNNLRGGGGETVKLKPETRTLRFKLLIDPADVFPSYQLALTQNGREIRSWRGLRLTRNGGIGPTVDLPVAGLSDLEYSFELRGVNRNGTVEDAGRYSFRIAKP